MEQPNKPYAFPASEILTPALKVGALTGKLVLFTYGASRNLSYLHIVHIQDENWLSENYICAPHISKNDKCPDICTNSVS